MDQPFFAFGRLLLDLDLIRLDGGVVGVGTGLRIVHLHVEDHFGRQLDRLVAGFWQPVLGTVLRLRRGNASLNG
jgi:hypothetical protein